MHILCVAGARPNFMKIKPVIDALESNGARTTIVHTGQHYDPEMSGVFFSDLGMRAPEISLKIGSGTHASQTAEVMKAFEPVVADLQPDIVLVVGDVNSTLAAAIVVAKSPARLAHVEAGLRSGDLTMPEEINRLLVDRVSDYLFAPSADAVDNLRAEGIPAHKISLVGNVMIDTLQANIERARARPLLKDLGIEGNRYAVATLHRPANVDQPRDLERFMTVFAAISEKIPLILPLHPRTRARLDRADSSNGPVLIDPLGYLDFLCLQASASLVLTDSGGVQEETTALGIPCLTLRDSTERPITIDQGTNRLAGRDPAVILAAARDALENPPPPRKPPLWDGRSSERIAGFLLGEPVSPMSSNPG